MKQYIYDVLVFGPTKTTFDVIAELNERGKQGWELVAVTLEAESEYECHYLMKGLT